MLNYNGRLNRLRPLNQTKSNGEPYRRLPDVERQIQDALLLDPTTIINRAKIKDKTSTDFLKEEAVIYMIREYHLSGRYDVVSDLGETLVVRCSKFINSEIKKHIDNIDEAEDCYGEVICELFGRIVDLDSKSSAFAEVLFWTFLGCIIQKRINSHIRGSVKKRAAIPLSEEIYNDPQTQESYLPAQERVLLEKEAMAALTRLPLDLKEVFVLYHYEGWLVESEDPERMTISKRFGKTGRTIRNMLRRADIQLTAWSGGKN